MVRSRRLLVAGIGLALALVGSTMAGEEGRREGRGQRRPPGAAFRRGMMGGLQSGFWLLRLEQVQKELKVTEEQLAKINEAQAEMREQGRLRIDMRGWRDLSQEERAKRMEEMRKAREERAKAAEKKLAEILNKEQMARLEGISLQLRGVQGLKDEEVAKKLKLKEEQIAKIDAAIESGREAQRQLFEEMRSQRAEGAEGGRRRFDPEAIAKMNEQREKIQKETMDKALKALTEEQQKQYKKMVGAPFELDRSAMMPRRGFGTRPGGAAERGGRAGPRGERPERPQRRARPEREV